jgi:hypothetical protein
VTTQLEQLRKITTVVADTGDISAIAKYKPEDATTNPSLLLKAAGIPTYSGYIDEAVQWAKGQSNNREQQLVDAGDRLAVLVGREILKIVPGKVSTEVDARLSFDTNASIDKAKRLIGFYDELGIKKERILIKLASTWEGIRAAEKLQKEGITATSPCSSASNRLWPAPKPACSSSRRSSVASSTGMSPTPTRRPTRRLKIRACSRCVASTTGTSCMATRPSSWAPASAISARSRPSPAATA